ncbi:hypothetical protein, variant 1 [Aphanomyces invadans]|uniref:Uncharacterized protein n=1 Tax=Aphanomyces invadans TaxID=157072 RepID=A0A024T9Z0_9STRA|nr:hypothetical protein, variant 1 [Aphanomyces invadans]ETV90824.1 hypothetical protein, variant 1 [Aphanomyces invadans]|eukprot:XP_008880581.1 hypothetical protein, variant 1 [Aphanomyces invadans]
MAQPGSFPRGPPSHPGGPGFTQQPPRGIGGGPYGPPSAGRGDVHANVPQHTQGGGASHGSAFPPQQHQPPLSTGGGHFQPQQPPFQAQQPPRSNGGFPSQGPPFNHGPPGQISRGAPTPPGPQQGGYTTPPPPQAFPPQGGPPPAGFAQPPNAPFPGSSNLNQGGPMPGFRGPPPPLQNAANVPPFQQHHPPYQGAPGYVSQPPPHMLPPGPNAGNHAPPNQAPVFTPGPPFHQNNPAQPVQPKPAAPATTQQRIDPTQIPRPLSRPDAVTYVAKGPTLTMPPPANSKYICIDDGCANPRFIRPSLNHVPESRDLLHNSGLPLGAVVCPLAKLQPGELAVPLVDFGATGPLRCTRCKAYVNCFTKFIQGGRMFACNICTMQNETPRDYYCAVDQLGKRRDVQERMELARGSVEFLVPSVYSVRPAQEVIVVFCLDVSVFAFQSNLVASVIASLPAVLETLQQTSPHAKFGLMTFDSAVHYYRLDQDQISMVVCPDVDDPAAPVPAQAWLLPVQAPDALDKIQELQDLILSLFGTAAKNQSVSGAAVTSAVDSLLTSGGRICLFHAGPPRSGVGKITKEEAASSYGTTKEVELYAGRGVHAHYEELARLSAKSFISIDIVSAANPYSDLAEVARLAELTGGYVLHLPQFDKDKPEHFQYTTKLLTHVLRKDKGMEAVLKIRVSTGLRVDSIYGSYMPSGASDDEVNIALLDQDTAVGVTFLYDGKLPDEHMYIQVALLYTRPDGVRCVRVHNLALPVANLVTNVFRHADLDATCALWQRMAVKVIRDKSIMSGNGQAVKEKLVDDCVQVLSNYRKHCATNSSSGQLILPESLKLLPLYTLASLKSRALRNNLTGQQARGVIDVRADERVMLLHHLNSFPVEHAVSAVYPKMYALHDLTEEIGTVDEKGEVMLPVALPPTAEKLDENGLFLLHSSTYLYLFIGAKTNPTLLEEVFGASHIDTSEQSVNLVGDADGTGVLRTQIQAVVSHLQLQSPVPAPLEIMTKSDWRSNRFLSALVEDRTRNEVSYVEFLCQVHKKIQYKMM